MNREMPNQDCIEEQFHTDFYYKPVYLFILFYFQCFMFIVPLVRRNCEERRKTTFISNSIIQKKDCFLCEEIL